MPRYPTHKEKAKRAFGAYMELLDAAEWMKGELRGPLLVFDLTMGEFRLLELLYREGAQFLPDIARKRRSHPQGIDVIVRRLERRELVRRGIVRLPPVDFERAHLATAMRDERREGKRVTVVGLSKSGKKLMGNALPRHTKVVRALMRALNATEQDSLARLCCKLREGDVVKFVREITHEDVD